MNSKRFLGNYSKNDLRKLILESERRAKFLNRIIDDDIHLNMVSESNSPLKEKYKSMDNIRFQLDFSETDTVWKADLLITDWSDISSEYAYCTHNPVLFIDTPMKIMNPEYKKIVKRCKRGPKITIAKNEKENGTDKD